MAGIVPAQEVILLNTLLTGTYLSLHTADPGDTGANEVVGGAYARQAATFTNAGGDPTSASNDALIQFPAATADWGAVTHVGVWDAVAAGNFRYSKALTVSKDISVDDVFRFLIGGFVVTLGDVGEV